MDERPWISFLQDKTEIRPEYYTDARDPSLNGHIREVHVEEIWINTGKTPAYIDESGTWVGMGRVSTNTNEVKWLKFIPGTGKSTMPPSAGNPSLIGFYLPVPAGYLPEIESGRFALFYKTHVAYHDAFKKNGGFTEICGQVVNEINKNYQGKERISTTPQCGGIVMK